MQDDDGLNDGFSAIVNFPRDPSLPPTVPSQGDWYASGNLQDEDGILNDDENTHPEVEARPDDTEPSALTTLGQLKNTLPEIPCRGLESQE